MKYEVIRALPSTAITFGVATWALFAVGCGSNSPSTPPHTEAARHSSPKPPPPPLKVEPKKATIPPTPKPKIAAGFILHGRVDLGRSIRYGLQRNLNIRISESQMGAARENLNIAKAEFDPRFSGEVAVEQPDSDSTLVSADAEVSKKVSSGGVLSMGGRIFTSRVNEGSLASFSSSSRLTPAQLLGAFLPSEALTDDMLEGSRSSIDQDATTEVVATFRQPLLQGGGFESNRAGLTLAKLSIDQADITLKAQVLELIRGSETAYWVSSAARSLLELEERSLSRSQEVLKKVQERRKLQDAILVDVLEAEAAVAEQEANMQDTAKRFQDSQDDLWLLLGFPVNYREKTYAYDALESYKPIEVHQLDPEYRYELAMKAFPDVLLLVNAAQQKRVELIRAKRDALPRLDLEATAGYRRDSNSLTGDIPNKLFWGGAIEFSMPWNLRAERARLRQVEAELKQSTLAQKQGERELMRSIRSSCREVQVRNQQLKAIAHAADVTERKWEQMQLRYKQGLVTVRDLLEAEEEAREAKRRELETRLRLIASESGLAQLDGSLLNRHGVVW